MDCACPRGPHLSTGLIRLRFTARRLAATTLTDHQVSVLPDSVIPSGPRRLAVPPQGRVPDLPCGVPSRGMGGSDPARTAARATTAQPGSPAAGSSAWPGRRAGTAGRGPGAAAARRRGSAAGSAAAGSRPPEGRGPRASQRSTTRSSESLTIASRAGSAFDPAGRGGEAETVTGGRRTARCGLKLVSGGLDEGQGPGRGCRRFRRCPPSRRRRHLPSPGGSFRASRGGRRGQGSPAIPR